MEKKAARGPYVDGAFIPPQEEPIVVKRVNSINRPVNENKDKK